MAAIVRYRGEHQEPSFAFPILGATTPVLPFGTLDLGAGYRSRRIESVCLPANVWRPVNPFVAIYLAGIRRRHGPWFDVRLTPAQWQEIRRRAPWIQRAYDAIRLCDPEVTRGLYAMTMNRYEVVR